MNIKKDLRRKVGFRRYWATRRLVRIYGKRGVTGRTEFSPSTIHKILTTSNYKDYREKTRVNFKKPEGTKRITSVNYPKTKLDTINETLIRIEKLLKK